MSIELLISNADELKNIENKIAVLSEKSELLEVAIRTQILEMYEIKLGAYLTIDHSDPKHAYCRILDAMVIDGVPSVKIISKYLETVYSFQRDANYADDNFRKKYGEWYPVNVLNVERVADV